MAISSQKLSILIITVFFFASPHSSLSSNPFHSNRCPYQESQALLHLKAALNESYDNFMSWVNGTDCCTGWEGISCDNHTNHVVSISMDGFSYFQGMISESLCQLRFLTSLRISGIGTSIPQCLANLTLIQSLNLSMNSFSGIIPPFLCSLTRLTGLELSYNNFNGSIPSCLGNLSSLTYLMLAGNSLSGSIPASLGSLSLLRELLLGNNQLIGTIPDSLGNLSSLDRVELNNNQLSGCIPASLGNLSLLRYLAISFNQISGTIPSSFAQLSSLTRFSGHGNRFNETISSSSLPPSLNVLALSLNHHQSISETFFYNLTSLELLYLSDCLLNISTIWIPSFQLSYLEIVSCTIDGEFPPWISTQFSLEMLKVTDANLVGVIPSWLWETSSLLTFLNLSGNHLEGSISSNNSIWMQLQYLDLSKNRLSGSIPSMWSSVLIRLLLNDNLFSGNIPPSLGKVSQFWLLNLANNNMTGMIPSSLSNCSSLSVLNLGNNSFEGSLPHEFNMLSELSSLVVHGNKLKELSSRQ